MWDDEVDVVCTGSGSAVLATAIAAVDDELDVFVARPAGEFGARPIDDESQSWFGQDYADPETSGYFMSLSADLGAPNWPTRDSQLAIRVVDEVPPPQLRSAIEPFFGARLRDWAARCLASPYGFLSTRIADRTTMRTSSGESIQVADLGAIDLDNGLQAESALNEWLLTHAQDRRISVIDNAPLTRIVFEEGEVTGAVFETPDGPYAVRARHGVTVAPGRPTTANLAAGPPPAGYGPLRVCLVGQTASRFGRIELLSPTSAAANTRATCGGINRRLHQGLREPRASRSQSWRCRKVHGHPPTGQ